MKKLLSSVSLLLAFLYVGVLSVPAVSAATGGVVVNEFMANPVSVSDANGEWIELYNSGNTGVDLTGWRIDSHTLTVGNAVSGSLEIAANGHFLVCSNANAAGNGGVACDYRWAGMALRNTNSDTITLRDDGNTIVDQVPFNTSNDGANATPGSSTNVERDNDNNVTALTTETEATYGPDAQATNVQHGSPAQNCVANPRYPNHSYATIQSAIDDAEPNDVLTVCNGNHTENITITRSITLQGESLNAIISGVVTVSADTVVLKGLTFTNPGAGFAVKVGTDTASSNVVIENNIFSTVGSDAFNGDVQALYVQLANNLTVRNNTFTNIASQTRSAKAIFVGDFGNTTPVSGITISGNTISDIRSGQRGSYGVLINRSITAGDIRSNSVTSLQGLWAHGVSLDGSTPNTTVRNNSISGFTGVFTAAVNVEDNNGASSVSVTGNTFKNVTAGVRNDYTDEAHRVSAPANWWGDASGPLDTVANDASLPETNNGTGVAAIGAVDYRGWTTTEPGTGGNGGNNGGQQPGSSDPAPTATPMTSPATTVAVASATTRSGSTGTTGASGSTVQSDTDQRDTSSTSDENEENRDENEAGASDDQNDQASDNTEWYWWIIGAATLGILYYLFGGRNRQ